MDVVTTWKWKGSSSLLPQLHTIDGEGRLIFNASFEGKDEE